MRSAYVVVGLCAVVLLLGGISCDRAQMMDRLMQDSDAVDQIMVSMMKHPDVVDRMIDSICADEASAAKMLDKVVADPVLSNTMIEKLLANQVTSDRFMVTAVQDDEKVAQLRRLLRQR
ncbi:MAG: hypothetical protein AMJ46_02290 [Latescibacteria bacterium DG_63]|nr:MAG: hypothetical protein AMJ46_02290 [Latescibacteria bacterium DG_63]